MEQQHNKIVNEVTNASANLSIGGSHQRWKTPFIAQMPRDRGNYTLRGRARGCLGGRSNQRPICQACTRTGHTAAT